MKNQAPAAILNSTTPAQIVYRVQAHRVQAPRLTRTPQSPYGDQPVIAADEQAMERDYSSSTLTDICNNIHLKFEPDRVCLDLALFNEHSQQKCLPGDRSPEGPTSPTKTKAVGPGPHVVLPGPPRRDLPDRVPQGPSMFLKVLNITVLI